MSDQEFIKGLAGAMLALNIRKQGGIAGQAFTQYRCRVCMNEEMHENTNTPYMCSDCTKRARALTKLSPASRKGGEA